MRLVVALVGLAVLVPACASPDDSDSVVVFAAASLTGAFSDIEDAFEANHPGVDVVLNLAASSSLAAQISEGAPVDVFASADEANMDVVAERVVGDVVTFARTRLQIITEAGNPLGITSVADLARPSILFVTCDPAVPIGRYTANVLARAGVEPQPVSLEESVKGIVTKVTSGEADVGIVYETDVLAAGASTSGVEIPEEFNVTVSYPIARFSASRAAQDFVEFLSSDEATTILAAYGFDLP